MISLYFTVYFYFFVFLGMINILHGLGLRLLALGHHTPFMVCFSNVIQQHMLNIKHNDLKLKQPKSLIYPKLHCRGK